jgi:hypothetical protein
MSDDIERLRKKPGRASRASASAALGNGVWKKRQIEILDCPSGQQVQIRRPGPEFTLRAGKVARTFSEVLTRKTEEEKDNLQVVAAMTDEERDAVMLFARELVCAMVVNPRLVQNPKGDELGPDDIGEDFWFLFNYGMTGFFNLPVPVGSAQEVEVADLKSFRAEPGVSGDSPNRAEVRPDTEQPPGDTELVDRA